MSNIQELEKQLAQAKEKEKKDSLIKECESVKLEYEGKAFGSREFKRNSKSASDHAIYIKEIYIGIRTMGSEQAILADIWSVAINRYDGNYNYSRSRDTEMQLSSKDTNVSWNIYQKLPWLKKEIPIEKFMSLWDAGLQHERIIQDALKSNLGEYQEMITQGDHGNEAKIEKAISTLGLEIIDVQKEYPKLWEEIKYCNLPMFQNQRWLPKQFAKDVLLYQISLWEEDKRSLFSGFKNINWRDRQIKVINDHLHHF